MAQGDLIDGIPPCTGCRHLVTFSSGRGVCRWPERHGKWEAVTDPLTKQVRMLFHHADGKVESGSVWRPFVEQERVVGGRCGPDRVNYEPSLTTRILDKVFGHE